VVRRSEMLITIVSNRDQNFSASRLKGFFCNIFCKDIDFWILNQLLKLIRIIIIGK
jgi:hypothetical protein